MSALCSYSDKIVCVAKSTPGFVTARANFEIPSPDCPESLAGSIICMNHVRRPAGTMRAPHSVTRSARCGPAVQRFETATVEAAIYAEAANRALSRGLRVRVAGASSQPLCGLFASLPSLGFVSGADVEDGPA